MESFFRRHQMLQNPLRYKTKAANFYKTNMGLHIQKILDSGTYLGRVVYRERRNSADNQISPESRQPTPQDGRVLETESTCYRDDAPSGKEERE